MIEIYTDGSCKNGVGGWAGIILAPDTSDRIVSGRVENTTSNAMELHAAVEALSALERPATVTLYTDSLYLVRGLSEWVERWEANDWRRTRGGRVKNLSYWKRLYALSQKHDITMKHVKGHNGNFYNEKADTLARQEATRKNKKRTHPGNPISPGQVQLFWVTTKKYGFTEAGVRELLRDYGLESSKDITTGIFDDIMITVRSGVVAEIYNNRALLNESS